MGRKLRATAAVLAIMLLVTSLAGPVSSYVKSVKTAGMWGNAGGTLFGLKGREARDLQARIRDEAAARRIEPVNAVIDPVWKAIPGYNGLEVDVDKTLKLAMERPMSDSIPFVYKEIRPAVELDDLPPAPVYKGNPKKPMTAFMINVAWGEAYLPGLLEVLREAEVKATFFLDGRWLSEHQELAAQMAAAGHELSNHGYSHQRMSRLGRAQIIQEIGDTERLLKQIGVQNRWFAPPYGDYDERTVRIAHEMGLRTVLWTLDTIDWKNPDPAWIVRKIDARLEPGSLILLHPTEAALKALPGMIESARKKGLAIGTVRETLSSNRVAPVERKTDF